jgi:hypothetical protein
MNKRLTIVLLIFLAVISSFATQSRMSGLGNPYGLIEDDTDIFTYPATIFQYDRMAVGELQQASDSAEWSMSANIPILNYKLGVYLNQDTGLTQGNWTNYYVEEEDVAFDLDISKSVEFNFGFNDHYAVGFGTSIDYESETNFTEENGDTRKFEPAANFYTLFGGYSANNLDLGLRLNIANTKNVAGDLYEYEDGFEFFEGSYLAFVLDGRKIFRPQYNLEIVVKAGLSMDLRELNYEKNDGSKIRDIERTDIVMDLGMSLQFKPNEKNRVIFGVTPIIYNPTSTEDTDYIFIDEKDKTTIDFNTLVFPEYNLAIESEICSWLTGRFGANQVYEHLSLEFDDGSDYKAYAKEFYMNLGLTFSIGNFCIDSVLEQELLFDGPNFIGGKSNGLASEISVKYQF